MNQEATDIVFFLVFYTLLYGTGLFISWLWLPFRLLGLLFMAVGIWSVTGGGVFWNLGRPMGVILPIVIVSYPTLAKTLSFRFGIFNPFRFIWERIEEKRQMRLRTVRIKEEKERSEREREMAEREMAERMERISRMRAEEAERRRRYAREKAERARKNREQEGDRRDHGDSQGNQGGGRRERPGAGGGGGRRQERDPYEVLGVTRDMSAADIRKAYLKKMTEYAPDYVSHLSEEFQKMAHEKCVEFNLAWEKIKKEKG